MMGNHSNPELYFVEIMSWWRRLSMNKNNTALLSAQRAVTGVLLLIGCQFPYDPQVQPPPLKIITPVNDTDSIAGSGRIYPVNGDEQVCNPSVSQGGNFPGCMLWLGFNRLFVSVPDSLSGYQTTAVTTHDRLTITDTSNTVRWYLMMSDLNQSGTFQCPEWSTHPDYIACLTGAINKPFSGYAVRLSDKKSLHLCNNRLEEFSTPHFWLADSAQHGGIAETPEFDTNGFVKKELVQKFFGTTRFKFVYTLLNQGGTLFYIDYSSAESPAPVPLKKPKGYESWYAHSPLISPDGNWVAYHIFSNATQGTSYRSYIQKLDPSAEPVFIAEKASDPHWWALDDDYYIVYTVTSGAYFSEFDYTDYAIEASGDAGATVIQKLKGSWRDVPDFIGTLAPDERNSPYTLIKLPFKGGLSRDGRFLCTAYKSAYIVHLK